MRIAASISLNRKPYITQSKTLREDLLKIFN